MANKDFKIKNGLDMSSPLPVAMGGTGQTSTTNTLNSLLPSQSGNANKVLSTDGTNTSFITLPVAYERGGTASRPASATAGDLYYNTDYNYFESHTANGWFPIAAAPTVPTSVVATDTPSGRAYNNGRSSVAFSIGTNGGAPTSLIVTPSPTTSPTTFTGSTSPILVTGLASSTQYTYTVSATSPYGTSAASSASSGVTATSVPQAPTIGAVTAGNALATVAYTTNATGGSAITTFTATSTPDSLTGTGASPITVSGLTNGTSYTFAVTATNANGTSAASAASSAVVPTEIIVPGAYDALATVTLSAATASITFAVIPSGYKHLQVRVLGRNTIANTTEDDLLMKFNGDTGANYTIHYVGGDGVNPFVAGVGTRSDPRAGFTVDGNALASTFASNVVDILDYSNTNKYKTTRTLAGSERNGAGRIMLESGVWMNTAAITQIVFTSSNSSNFAINSSFALYGVK